MPERVAIRCYEESDFSDMLSLRVEAEAHDRAGADVGEETLRAQLALPGHVPTRDRLVAIDEDGTMAAYGTVWLPPDESSAQVNAIVRPSRRREGIGRALVARTIDLARAAGATRAYAYAFDPAEPFLRALGFSRDGAYGEYRAFMPREDLDPRWPAGWRVAPYSSVGDLDLLADAMHRSYEGLWGHQEADRETVATWLRDFFDPEGVLLAFDAAGEIAGICRVEVRAREGGSPTGYVDAPGLVPARRAEDHRRSLLVEALAWLRARGCERLELESWGDPPEALALFGSFGFEKSRGYAEWGKRIR